MSFELPAVTADYFFKQTYRGLPECPTHRIQVGGLNQGRVAKLAVVYTDGCFHAAGFKAFGDQYTIATFSWLCEIILQQNSDFLATLEIADIARALALPDHKLGCALLAQEGLTQLLELTCKKMNH